MTFGQFLKLHNIKFSATKIPCRTDGIHLRLNKEATHWVCCFYYSGDKFAIQFSQRPGHKTKPKAQDVLNSIMSDIHGIRCASDFADWAHNLEYTMDQVRQAQMAWDATKEEERALSKMLGSTLFETLLNCTEE